MVEEVKSTHSDSAAAGAVTPAGGTNKKRPADKNVGDKVADKLKTKDVSDKVGVESAGKVRKEDLDLLFQGTELSEEFQNKAFNLFEGAVSVKVSEITEELREEFEAELVESKAALEERLSDYLEIIADNYMKENELAIENGIKAEISESLLTALKDILSEHNIDVPEDKIDIVESLSERIAELEVELNESIVSNAATTKLIEAQAKKDIMDTLTEGMDDVSKDKLVKLTNHLSFDDHESFTEAATMLKETVNPSKSTSGDKTQLNESVDINDSSSIKINSNMQNYLNTSRAMSKV